MSAPEWLQNLTQQCADELRKTEARDAEMRSALPRWWQHTHMRSSNPRAEAVSAQARRLAESNEVVSLLLKTVSEDIARGQAVRALENGEPEVDVAALPGTFVVNGIFETLSTLSDTPSEHQKIFIRKIVNVFLPLIYDGRTWQAHAPPNALCDWDRYKKQIAAFHSMTYIIPSIGVVISTPRQFGKTTAISMVAASMVINVPFFNILAISTGERISRMLGFRVLGYIFDAARTDPDIRRRLSYNADSVYMRSKGEVLDDGSRRMSASLRMLPSKSETLRGLSGDAILVDEAAYTGGDVLKQFVLPLFKVKNRKLVAISTPATDSTSVFNQLINNDSPEFKNIFERYVVEGMCQACAAKQASHCPHVAPVTTPWGSSANQDALRTVMAQLDQSTFNREVLGAQIADKVPAFEAAKINRLFSDESLWFTAAHFRRPTDLETPWRPPVIFMGIDPSGGGDSDTGIVTAFYDYDWNFVILGCDSVPSVDGDHVNVFKRIAYHRDAVRAIPYMTDVQFVYIIEENLSSQQVSTIVHYLREPRGIGGKEMSIFMSSPKRTGDRLIPGITVAGGDKQRFVSSLSGMLDRNTVRIMAKDLFVTYVDPSKNVTRERALSDLRVKLLTFARNVKPPKDSVFGKTAVEFSGKGGGAKDDVTMALLFIPYYSALFFYSSHYVNLVPALGRRTYALYHAQFNKFIREIGRSMYEGEEESEQEEEEKEEPGRKRPALADRY